jgi:hypothetical protein
MNRYHETLNGLKARAVIPEGTDDDSSMPEI